MELTGNNLLISTLHHVSVAKHFNSHANSNLRSEVRILVDIILAVPNSSSS
jgi:hypothetical protein